MIGLTNHADPHRDISNIIQATAEYHVRQLKYVKITALKNNNGKNRCEMTANTRVTTYDMSISSTDWSSMVEPSTSVDSLLAVSAAIIFAIR